MSPRAAFWLSLALTTGGRTATLFVTAPGAAALRGRAAVFRARGRGGR